MLTHEVFNFAQTNMRVPEMYLQVELVVAKLIASAGTVLTVDALKRKVASTTVDPRLSRYGDVMWQRCLTYLQDCGILLFDSVNNRVCLQPEVVLRLLGGLLLGNPSNKTRWNTCVEREALLAKLRSLHPLSRSTDQQLVDMVQFMEGINLCWALSERERQVRSALCKVYSLGHCTALQS